MPTKPKDEHQFLLAVLEGLRAYDDADKLRLLRTIMTYFNLVIPRHDQSAIPAPARDTSTIGDSGFATRRLVFSGHEDMSPKDFLQLKAPRTDIERVACLGYYLTHFRDQKHFKTFDISKLNTEAARAKLSNAAHAVNNATQRGLLAAAGKGMKQLSADGEDFVDALPNRDVAKTVAERFAKRKARNSRTKKNRRKSK